MGLKDLSLCNESLLVKQTWRLLHNKDSLFYKIFKARFFPHGSLMEAKDLATRSYAWKSILIGQDVIQRGACWRVGNGKSIKIWQHHWLPIKHPTKIAFPIIDSTEETTVDCLIDDDDTRT